MSTRTVIAHTGLGEYEGLVDDGGIAAFKGIPYARPPIGELRFQAPQPVAAHSGVRPCVEYGPTAPKSPYPPVLAALLSDPVIAGDDYLNLNVWTPATAVEAAGSTEAAGLLPVLVWVHGGAFVHGTGAVPAYDGTAFARDGVIVVTINYRIGLDGFGLLDGHPANRGLLDQIAALTWVRDNIAGFGGDPGRVTVAGESAGAMSVNPLLSMPLAEGLFQQAITQSGGAQHVLTPATARRIVAELAAILTVEPTAQALAAVPTDDLVAAEAVLSAALITDPDPARWGEVVLHGMPFEPTVDGEVLPAPPLAAIRAGAGAGVRLLTGTNRDEMTLFLVPRGVLKQVDQTLLTVVAGQYGLPPERLATYPQTRPEADLAELLVDVVTDWFFRIPTIRIAEARNQVDGAEPTYLYEFSWPTPQWDGRLGATHALEIAFAFDTLTAGLGTGPHDGTGLLGANPPQKLADVMHTAWVAFVGTGDPGWPAYRDDRAVMTFNLDSELVLDPRGQVRAAWDGLR